MSFKKFIFIMLLVILSNCNSLTTDKEITNEVISDKIKILNFGSIHLTNSTDLKTSFVDINNPKVKTDITKIVNNLIQFQPTIICIEMPVENNDFVNQTYQKYIIDQSNRLNYSDEINSIAFEVGRLSGVKKIYGIDSQINFDYLQLIKLANQNISDSLVVVDMMESYERLNSLPLLNQYEKINSKPYKMETFNFYNFLATMHTPQNYEGANIIADLYNRNLRMYANLNEIPFTNNDRVLIILGATHTAYLDIFIENENKFHLENTENYLKFE